MEFRLTDSKVCSRCKQVKSFDEFHNNKSKPDGKHNYCKICLRAAITDSRKKDPTAKNRAVKKWRANNKDKVNVAKRAWREANKDRVNAQKRAWNAANKDKIHTMNQKQYEQNPEQFIRNAAKRHARKKQVEQRLITTKDLARMYQMPCIYCGKTEQIEIDHIQPISRNGRNSIGNLAPACMSCNRSKSDLWVMEWRLRKLKEETPQSPTHD